MGPYCGMTAPKAPPLAASSRGCHLANDTAAGPELQLRAPGRSEDPRNSPWGWPRAGAPLRQLGVGAGCGGAGQAVVRPPPHRGSRSERLLDQHRVISVSPSDLMSDQTQPADTNLTEGATGANTPIPCFLAPSPVFY